MAGPPADASFARHLTTFGRILRESGLPVGPTRLLAALQALDVVGVTTRDDVYWALRSTLVSDYRALEAFDVAFTAFWERAPHLAPWSRPPQELERGEQAEADAGTRGQDVGDRLAAHAEEGEGEGDDDPDARSQGLSWSGYERLQSVDFGDYGEDELREATAVLADIARTLPRRRSRRMQRAPSGRHLDTRRTLQQAMRTEGHPLRQAWRRNKYVPRKLVFLLDISGSMHAYARPLLIFAGFMARAAPKVEVFSFGTRLTRLTRPLSRLAPADALQSTGRLIPDWSGGTRIGESLKQFNDLAARSALTRGAAVVVVSDGWERGDITLLRDEMARLQRSSHDLVWVNPAAGDPDYQPLVGGMAAALPSVDLFLPGHDLRSIGRLADVLAGLSRHRHGSARARRADLTVADPERKAHVRFQVRRPLRGGA